MARPMGSAKAWMEGFARGGVPSFASAAATPLDVSTGIVPCASARAGGGGGRLRDWHGRFRA